MTIFIHACSFGTTGGGMVREMPEQRLPAEQMAVEWRRFFVIVPAKRGHHSKNGRTPVRGGGSATGSREAHMFLTPTGRRSSRPWHLFLLFFASLFSVVAPGCGSEPTL